MLPRTGAISSLEHMKKLTIKVVLALLCHLFTIYTKAQTPVQPLNEGMPVPDSLIRNVLHHSKQTLRLSDYRGKLVILDFWGTFCAPCIRMKPVMDSLQKVFAGQLQFISVTSQSSKVITDFLSRKKRMEHWDFDMPEVVEDKLLAGLFPHRTVPHYIWIDQRGVYRAATSIYLLTADKIREFLQQGQLRDYEAKKDIDVKQPLFLSDIAPQKKMRYFSIFFKGHLETTNSGMHMRNTPETVGLTGTNLSLTSLCYRAGKLNVPDFSLKHLRYQLKDSSLIHPGLPKAELQQWLLDNEITFDIILPKKDSAQLKTALLALINHSSGFHMQVVSQSIPYLELIRKNPAQPLQSKGGDYLNTLTSRSGKQVHNAPLSHVIAYLNNEPTGYPLIKDQTGLRANVDLQLPEDIADLAQLKAVLNRQGFKLIEHTGQVTLLQVTN